MENNKVKNSNHRLKILYLYKILFENTDEEHKLSMPEIISKLSHYGITAGRKGLYEDINALRAFGIDIIASRGDKPGYYINKRIFSLPELKLLADEISSSKFITEKKSQDLIRKLGVLTSNSSAKQIERQIFVANRRKTRNESIFVNVDILQKAINDKKKISFLYFLMSL